MSYIDILTVEMLTVIIGEQERGQSRDNGRDPYEDGYYQPPNQNQYAQEPTHDPYGPQQGFHNQSQFPPPPGGMPQQYPAPVPTPQPAGMGYQQTYQPPQNTYQPPNAFTQPEPYAPQSYYPPPQNQSQHYDAYMSGANPNAQPRNRGADENVSAGNLPSDSFPSDQYQPFPDGMFCRKCS